MEDNFDNEQNENSKKKATDEESSFPPVIALLFSIVPFILLLMSRDVFVLFFISIFPLVGFLMGVGFLCSGKARISKTGMVIAIIAVAFPIIFISTVILFDATGSLTMNM